MATAKNATKKSVKPAVKKAAKPVAKKKAAAKPVAKAPLKKAPKKAVKKVSDYDRFIANVAPGQQVTIHNHRMGTTHTTRVVSVAPRKIVTRRDGTCDLAIYTGKGNGTGATEGTTVIPHTISHYRKPRANAKSVSLTPDQLRKSIKFA